MLEISTIPACRSSGRREVRREVRCRVVVAATHKNMSGEDLQSVLTVISSAHRRRSRYKDTLMHWHFEF